MLNATELAVAVLFVVALLLLSILDIAFTNTSRIALRRILDTTVANVEGFLTGTPVNLVG